MGEKKAFKKFPKKQHIKNDTPSVQERVEEVYDDGRVLLKEKPHRNGRHPASFYGAGKIRMYAMSVFALFFMIFLTLLLFPIPFGQIQISGTGASRCKMSCLREMFPHRLIYCKLAQLI